MSVLRKQSFRTTVDTYLVLLCYMRLYFPMVFQDFFSKTTVTSLYGVFLVPPSQYCTSLRYHVVLLSIIMLYFCPSQYCTSLCYHICIFHHDLFSYFPLSDFIIFLALHVKVALPKLKTYTSCRHCVYFPESLVVLHQFLQMIHHFRNRSRGLNICTSCCQYMYFLLSYLCTSR
jgi:hypothetical protein